MLIYLLVCPSAYVFVCLCIHLSVTHAHSVLGAAPQTFRESLRVGGGGGGGGGSCGVSLGLYIFTHELQELTGS